MKSGLVREHICPILNLNDFYFLREPPITVPKCLCRFALLGDVEPKPDPVFTWFERAIALINRLTAMEKIDFTACVGDIIHAGKLIQYQEATAIIKKLATPFFTIMGNEELNEGRERFMEFAAQWNQNPGAIPDISYVKEFGGIRFVFATAEDRGKTFTEAETLWIEEQFRSAPDIPGMLFIHASIPGIFPDAEVRVQ
jgi:Icc protein